MSEDVTTESPLSERPNSREPRTLGVSSLYRLCEEVIAMRERNDRRHQVFEQALTRTRDEMKQSFNSFAADTQRAYQQLRQEIHGEKRISLTLLNEILDIGFDMEQIVASRPKNQNGESLNLWAEGVEVQARKVQSILLRHGIHPYDAVIGAPYRPELHERVGTKKVEGLGPLLVAEQHQHGFASQQPEFVLRRPKVVVSE